MQYIVNKYCVYNFVFVLHHQNFIYLFCNESILIILTFFCRIPMLLGLGKDYRKCCSIQNITQTQYAQGVHTQTYYYIVHTCNSKYYTCICSRPISKCIEGLKLIENNFFSMDLFCIFFVIQILHQAFTIQCVREEDQITFMQVGRQYLAAGCIHRISALKQAISG